MNKIIVPTGYMGSGSSAVTDLISELEGVSNEFNSFEYIFLHCPNGVFDLEDKLLHGNNSIRSDEALHSFLEMMKSLYDTKFWWPGNYKKIVHPDFYKVVNEYVDELTDVKNDTYWYYQEKPTKAMMPRKYFNEIIKRLSKNKVILKPNLQYEGMLLSYKTPEEFYKITREFIYRIIRMVADTNEDILLDQFLLPHNLYRMPNYFDSNFYAVVVERDPRDVFILNKYVWKVHNVPVPYSLDVAEFCKQYKSIREGEKDIDSKNVLRVRFEDLVYDYENSVEKVLKFLNFDKTQHVRKLSRFNPKASIKNTQVFKSDEKFADEVKYIEEHLSSYLYEFPFEVVSKTSETFD